TLALHDALPIYEPVAVAIRRPEESRHQMMRENGGAELVGLLRVLAGGTRGEDGQSLRRAALEGDVELRHRRAALDARDRTRLAGVDHENARARGRTRDEILELREIELCPVEVDRPRVAVPGVVDEDERGAGLLADARVEFDER